MITYKFKTVKTTKSVTTFCTKCQKILKRVLSESQTLNPFNKNKDGTIKTDTQIRKENNKKLLKTAKIVETKGVVCRNCENKN